MSSSNGPRTSLIVPPFRWSHLWEPAIVNPVNFKSYTIPIFNLKSLYGRAFHLSWLAFFVAFLSWFAFPPLIPDAIKSDLHLTNAQVGNSNIIALSSTLLFRIAVGPMVDRYGPRKVMAWLLILGAIPSGLAGLAQNAQSFYVLRFFIGILGATFVPCQAWTSAFFDTSRVGTANALVAGWGNMGGGATYAIMAGLFQSLTQSLGLSPHIAWRVAFTIVPVPILLLIAGSVFIFGQDHPSGRWEERLNSNAFYLEKDHDVTSSPSLVVNKKDFQNQDKGFENARVEPNQGQDGDITPVNSISENTVKGFPTLATYFRILMSPVTWLPTLAYMTTFGLELAIDSNLGNVLFSLFNTKRPGFTQTQAGYYTSIFGFLNLVTRPLGGYIGDVIYRFYGTKGKKAWIILCGFIMGATFLAGGLYLQSIERSGDASLPILMAVFSVTSIFSELGNGACFALVPHLPHNGFMSGLVGAFGNFGGIIFVLIFRLQTDVGKACWIIGTICMAVNALLIAIRVPAL